MSNIALAVATISTVGTVATVAIAIIRERRGRYRKGGF